MTQARKHTKTPRAAHSICREWRQVHLKCAYEVSMIDPEDDNSIDLAVDVAVATQRELERDLTDATMATNEDASAVLGIALCLLQEGWGAETGRIEHLIQVARRGLLAVCPIERRAAA
jgi:hypothetical protein